MGFAYHHLDEAGVREAMVEAWRSEWDDLSTNWPRGQCYGKQLTDAGWDAFEVAMPEALAVHDDDWLLEQMGASSYWLERSPRRTKSGITMVNYNKADALQRLSFGEFNVAYIHGVAIALLARGETMCVVYRANPAYQPRGECSNWEGREFPLADVLAGHRARYHPPPGDGGAWSIPTGPNCHHSIRSLS